MNWDNISIGDELAQYNMIGEVIHIDINLQKVVLYFPETKEEIQFDFDEFN